MRLIKHAPITLAVLQAFACTFEPQVASATPATPQRASSGCDESLQSLAEGYVQLVLAIGQHDAAYVDAYFGPPAWRSAAQEAGKRPLPALVAEAERLLRLLDAVPPLDAECELRRAFLKAELASTGAKLSLLGGTKLSFDEEARALFGVPPPREDLARFEHVRQQMEALFPGEGTFPKRFERWRSKLVIPKEKIEVVFRTAAEEVRRRTREHLNLPAGESLSVLLVSQKPFFVNNRYVGDGKSIIEINTDIPTYVSSILYLAAHEGYPGHHTWFAKREAFLALGRGWVEHFVVPLTTPAALPCEGTAEAGLDVVFPKDEREKYERDVLYPLAGADPTEVSRAAAVAALRRELARADVAVARAYLDGALSRADAKKWLVSHAMVTPEFAEQKLIFFDAFRSYIVTYMLGRDLVEQLFTARGATTAAARWPLFGDLIDLRLLPGDPRAGGAP